MQLACDHALDTGNCVFLNEKRPQRILTLLDLTNPLIISVDQPKEKEKKSKYMYLVTAFTIRIENKYLFHWIGNTKLLMTKN